jgi:gliding motility-associated-like protein
MKQLIRFKEFIFTTAKLIYLLVILLLPRDAHSQTILNGDFENHAAVTDQINISNAAYNAIMTNSFGFGTYGDLDIVTSGTYCGLRQSGCWYVALTGNGTDAFSLTLSAPLVTGNSYTMSFWDKGCFPNFSNAAMPVQIGVSLVNNTFGTAVYTGPVPANGVWTQRIFTFTAPNNGQYITVRLQGGGLQDWTQVDHFSFSPFTTTQPCVQLPPVANFNASDTSICAGDCISFTDLSTNNPTSWNWNFTGGTPAFSNIQNPGSICYNTPGNYTVTLTATNNFGSNTSTHTSYIHVYPVPTANAGPNDTICSGGSTTLAGTGGPGYQWFPATGLSSTTIANPVANPNTTTTYYLAVSNGICSDTDSVTVFVIAQPAADAGNDVSICSGASTPLNASGGSSYQWFPSAGLSNPNISNPIATPSATTTYYVIASNGICADTDSVIITVIPDPVADAGNDVSICEGASTTLNASGGTSYLWYPSTGLSNPNISNPVATPSASTIYYVIVANGICADTDFVSVTVNPLPVVNISGNMNICEGEITTLTATGGGNYLWSSGDVTASAIVSPASTTSYTVTVTSAANCSATSSATVVVNPLPVADAGQDLSICIGDSVTLNATSPSGTIFTWSPATGLSNPNVSNPVATPLTTTTYAVIISNGLCSDTDSVTITVNPYPIANACCAATIHIGESASLNGFGGGTYVWSPAGSVSCPTCQSTEASPLTTTTFLLTVTGPGGCISTDTVTVTVDAVCGEVFVANVFSPNGDNVNDVLHVLGNCISILDFTVYDRWGKIIFETTDKKIGWDGTYNGSEVNEGVYMYILKATLYNRQTVEKKGNVTVIR